MSNQGFYGNQGQQAPDNNPFHQQQQSGYPGQQQQPSGYPSQQQQQTGYQSTQQQQPYNTAPSGYEAPPGPPPRKAGTFQESDFVPAAERSEQREVMEQFEMNRAGPESATDRDVATLQREFPAIDGSLIAAMYGDSQSLAATREMLHELSRE